MGATTSSSGSSRSRSSAPPPLTAQGGPLWARAPACWQGERHMGPAVTPATPVTAAIQHSHFGSREHRLGNGERREAEGRCWRMKVIRRALTHPHRLDWLCYHPPECNLCDLSNNNNACFVLCCCLHWLARAHTTGCLASGRSAMQARGS